MPSKPLTLADLTAYLATNPDQKAALVAYRVAAKAAVLDRANSQRGRRRKPIRSEDLDHWTVVLYGDFATAGPAVAQWHGFGRDQWPPLQCLRNYGPAFDPGFAGLIDIALAMGPDAPDWQAGKWSGAGAVPEIGQEVTVRINAIGRAVVLRRILVHGYTGVEVLPLDPPDWYVDQNGAQCPCTVFGVEIDAA